jgi:hypothetical protein
MHYADIHLIDIELTYERDGLRETYATTLDGTVSWDGRNYGLVPVEFSLTVLGDPWPVPRGSRATMFAALVAGDFAELMKHLKTDWRKAA